MKKTFLSPSSLNIFKNCPRCFWLAKTQRIDRPDTIFPSLPGGMDRILKESYDNFRAANALPEVLLEMPVTLFGDQRKLTAWRNWRTGLKVEGPDWTLGGALDDLLQTDHGTFIVPDFKTKGSEPKDGEGQKYYGGQFDSYGLMLRENGYKPEPQGVLIYYWPMTIEGAETGGVVSVKFGTKLMPVEVNPDRAYETCEAAAACLALPEPPAAGEECTFCAWHERMNAGGF